MVRAAAAWTIVAVSGLMILPKALGQMIHHPWLYAPRLAVWAAALIVAAAATHDALKRPKRPTSE